MIYTTICLSIYIVLLSLEKKNENIKLVIKKRYIIVYIINAQKFDVTQ